MTTFRDMIVKLSVSMQTTYGKGSFSTFCEETLIISDFNGSDSTLSMSVWFPVFRIRKKRDKKVTPAVPEPANVSVAFMVPVMGSGIAKPCYLYVFRTDKLLSSATG